MAKSTVAMSSHRLLVVCWSVLVWVAVFCSVVAWLVKLFRVFWLWVAYRYASWVLPASYASCAWLSWSVACFRVVMSVSTFAPAVSAALTAWVQVWMVVCAVWMAVWALVCAVACGVASAKNNMISSVQMASVLDTVCAPCYFAISRMFGLAGHSFSRIFRLSEKSFSRFSMVLLHR